MNAERSDHALFISGSISEHSHVTGVRDPDPLLGSIIDGRYLIERAVGRGGFGDVYRAIHLRFDSPVAIKVLRISPHLTGTRRQRSVDNFLAEGRLVFNLGALHSAIVRVFETGTLTAQDGLLAPYLVMDWLDGLPLDRAMRRCSELGLPALELPDVLGLLASCVEGLELAHQQQVTHRDIKPANIFVVKQAEKISTKLLDFGLAKASRDHVQSAAVSNEATHSSALFTPRYAAPEQWSSALGATGPWSDVFSLALVCLELWCGEHPLSGRNVEQLMAACLDADARPTPRALGLQVTDDVEAIFARALALDPRRRYPNVAEFWQALNRSAAGQARSCASFEKLFDELCAETQVTTGRSNRDRTNPPATTAPAIGVLQPVHCSASTAISRSLVSKSHTRRAATRAPLAGVVLVASAMGVFASSSHAGERHLGTGHQVRAKLAANQHAFDVTLPQAPPMLEQAVPTRSVQTTASSLVERRAKPTPARRSSIAASHDHPQPLVVFAEQLVEPSVGDAAQPRVPELQPIPVTDRETLLYHDALSRRK